MKELDTLRETTARATAAVYTSVLLRAQLQTIINVLQQHPDVDGSLAKEELEDVITDMHDIETRIGTALKHVLVAFAELEHKDDVTAEITLSV